MSFLNAINDERGDEIREMSIPEEDQDKLHGGLGVEGQGKSLQQRKSH